MNIIHIAGHLGADPEVRFTSSGQKVTVMRIAVKVRRKGEDDTIWYRVTIWGEQFDKMMSFLKKGSAVMVVGELQKPEIFTDRDGKPQISLNITASNLMFSPFGRTDRAEQPSSNSSAAAPVSSENAYAGFANGAQNKEEHNSNSFDDEIPF